MTDFSNPTSDPFAQYLRADERIAWSGQPDPKILFSNFDLLMVPFSIVWAGFAVVWNSAVWSSDAPIFFRIFGAPFLVVGFYITVGRFIVRKRRKAKVRYALTNQRAILLNRSGQVRWVELKDVLHATQPRMRSRAISVAFRRPNQPVTSSFTMFSDPEIDPMANYSGRNQYQSTVDNFIFSDVSDGTALLQALKDSPQAT